jgi:hypothetical protein
MAEWSKANDSNYCFIISSLRARVQIALQAKLFALRRD